VPGATMKTLLLATVILAAIVAPSLAHAKAKVQSCTGTLTRSEDYPELLQLVSDEEGLCGADWYLQQHQKKRVLKVCPLRSRCTITGPFAGHAGTFSWVKINSVRRITDEQ
jgi:hypothetical protein